MPKHDYWNNRRDYDLIFGKTYMGHEPSVPLTNTVTDDDFYCSDAHIRTHIRLKQPLCYKCKRAKLSAPYSFYQQPIANSVV